MITNSILYVLTSALGAIAGALITGLVTLKIGKQNLMVELMKQYSKDIEAYRAELASLEPLKEELVQLKEELITLKQSIARALKLLNTSLINLDRMIKELPQHSTLIQIKELLDEARNILTN